MADNEITKISEIDEDEFAAQAAANVGFTKAELIIPLFVFCNHCHHSYKLLLARKPE